MKTFRLNLLVGLLALAWGAACAGCSAQPCAVDGRVTLDGQPLDEAVILFVPQQAGTKKTGAAIVRGEYHMESRDGLVPGKYRVEIADNPPLDHPRSGAAHASSQHTKSLGRRRLIPHKYAHDSPLTVEVNEGKSVRFDFELSSQP